MEGIAHAIRRAYEKKWPFFGLFVLLFALTILVLARLGLLPSAPTAASAPTLPFAATKAAPSMPAAFELPEKVAIPAIGLSAKVHNPTTTDVPTLDAALLLGAVRYPTSAQLGQDNGNVVLFGHSSYLPIVHNPSYKTFDGIQKLVAGDVIVVYSADALYTYAVASVSKESADQAAIPLAVSGKVLTLSTCDSFGTTSDRFVVVANFVESHAVSG